MKKQIILMAILLSIFYCFSGDTKTSTITYKQRVDKSVYKDELFPISNLTFEDLKKLAKNSEIESNLEKKLNEQLSMVYVVNRMYESELDKPFLRVSHWNIKRGFNVSAIKEILLSPNNYHVKYFSKVRSREKMNFTKELNAFSSSDIFCLNEADIGLPRTDYKNIVSELADQAGWNYAYATEFIELGPLFLNENVDKDLYKGLHGNAIISKFPIVSSKVIRLPNFYDWYKFEIKEKQSPLEHFRKFGAMAIFEEQILHREVRRGGRNALIVNIKLPNNEIVTVVSTHFEDRAYPDWRLKQFTYLLDNLKDVKTPVILAGDFNTSTTDTMPTSLKKEVEKRIRDPHFFLRQAAFLPVPFVPVVGGVASVTFSKLLQYKDPFFPNIPILFPNHERKFFNCLKTFTFSDGNKFDLRGNKANSSNGKAGLLANSNQRHWKGFKSTFKLEKPRIIAYFKLDWFFIKPLSERFRPFNAMTLKTLNRSYKDGISDHNPITVDIRL